MAHKLYDLFSLDVKKVLNKDIRYQPFSLQSLAVAICKDKNLAGFKVCDTIKP